MIRGLDVFRALAFFMVFLFHCGLISFGYMGVQAFFVLSGFLLTPILLTMKEELPGRSYFKNFYGRRALRIFPLYYFYLLLAAGVIVVLSFFPDEDSTYLVTSFWDQLFWALTYLYDFYHASCGFEHNYFLSHFWSLAVEEQFYLIWPLLLFVIPRDKLKYLLVAFIILGPVFRGATLYFAEQAACIADNYHSSPHLVVYVLPFSHFDGFAIGSLVALYKPSKPHIQALVAGAAIVFLGIGLQVYTLGTFSYRSLGYEPFMHSFGQHIWGYSLFNYFFAMCLAILVQQRFWPLIFENKVMIYLGKISYGLYVYHFPIILAFQQLGVEPGWQLGMVSFPLSLVLSILSYELIEKRFLGMKDKLFPRS